MKQKRYSADQILEEFNSRSKLSDLISNTLILPQEVTNLLENVLFTMKKLHPLMLMTKKDFFTVLVVKYWRKCYYISSKNIIIFPF